MLWTAPQVVRNSHTGIPARWGLLSTTNTNLQHELKLSSQSSSPIPPIVTHPSEMGAILPLDPFKLMDLVKARDCPNLSHVSVQNCIFSKMKFATVVQILASIPHICPNMFKKKVVKFKYLKLTFQKNLLLFIGSYILFVRIRLSQKICCRGQNHLCGRFP